MKSVIYIEDGWFKLADMNEWIELSNKYRMPLKRKIIDMDLSLFNALQHSYSRQSQAFLRELYDGD
jgi:hypothetical protein